MAKDIAYTELLSLADQQFDIADHFLWYISPHLWTSLASDATVTAAATDAHGGVVALGSDTTDNNEVMVRSTNEVIKFGADRRFCFKSRIQFTEAATSAANVAVGLADAAGANLITDNGGAAAINSSGALIYKLDGGTVWRAYSKNNSVTTDSVSATTAGGAAYQTLSITGTPDDGGSITLHYFCDGQPLRDSNGKAIFHRMAYASSTEMRLVAAYLKCGSTSAETLLLDFCGLACRL
jgi:hypothetical protein